MVSEKLSGFDDNYQVVILGTVAASEIPRAAPQKHKEFQWFLKGALVESGWGAVAHFAPGRGWRRAAWQNCSFSHGFKGFLRKRQILMESVRSPSRGSWPPVEFQGGHLRNTRNSNGF